MKKSLALTASIALAMMASSRTQAGGSTETIITGIGGGSGDIKPLIPDGHGGGSGGINIPSSSHHNKDLNPISIKEKEGWDGISCWNGQDKRPKADRVYFV